MYVKPVSHSKRLCWWRKVNKMCFVIHLPCLSVTTTMEWEPCVGYMDIILCVGRRAKLGVCLIIVSCVFIMPFILRASKWHTLTNTVAFILSLVLFNFHKYLSTECQTFFFIESKSLAVYSLNFSNGKTWVGGREMYIVFLFIVEILLNYSHPLYNHWLGGWEWHVMGQMYKL